MRKLCLAVLICLFSFGMAFGQETVQFAWEQDVPADMKEWKLYQSTTANFNCQAAGDPVAIIEYTGQTEYTTTYQIIGEEGETFYFQLTAGDLAENESDCSNEVAYSMPDLPPGAPFNLTVDVVVTP